MRTQKGSYRLPNNARKLHIGGIEYHYVIRERSVTFYVGPNLRMYAKHCDVLGKTQLEVDNERTEFARYGSGDGCPITPSICKSYLESKLEHISLITQTR